MPARRSTQLITVALTCALSAGACGRSDRIYTLYRSSPVNDSLRIEVATFSADESGLYNRDTCEQAQSLFQHDNDGRLSEFPGVAVKVRFWCEKGRFRK